MGGWVHSAAAFRDTCWAELTGQALGAGCFLGVRGYPSGQEAARQRLRMPPRKLARTASLLRHSSAAYATLVACRLPTARRHGCAVRCALPQMRTLEEERTRALDAAARARAEVAELADSRRKLQWQSKLLEKMSEVRGSHTHAARAVYRLRACLPLWCTTTRDTKHRHARLFRRTPCVVSQLWRILIVMHGASPRCRFS